MEDASVSGGSIFSFSLWSKWKETERHTALCHKPGTGRVGKSWQSLLRAQKLLTRTALSDHLPLAEAESAADITFLAIVSACKQRLQESLFYLAESAQT